MERKTIWEKIQRKKKKKKKERDKKTNRYKKTKRTTVCFRDLAKLNLTMVVRF
jgi:hypothetical protein